MTIDETIVDVLNRTLPRSGLVATYAVRHGGSFFGYVEAQLHTHGSSARHEWDISWMVNWQNDKGGVETATSDDLTSLLQRFGEVDLAPACGHAPWKLAPAKP